MPFFVSFLFSFLFLFLSLIDLVLKQSPSFCLTYLETTLALFSLQPLLFLATILVGSPILNCPITPFQVIEFLTAP